jgi:PAS domain S-box-containing protein
MSDDRLTLLQRLTQDMNEADRTDFSLVTALANAVEGIACFDPSGRFLWVNDAYTSITGHPSSELEGKLWSEMPGLINNEDRPCMVLAEQELGWKGKSTTEFKAARSDGTAYWVRLTLLKSVDRFGKEEGRFHFVQDITQRKLDESHREDLIRGLQATERHIRALFSLAPAGMLVLSPEFECLRANQAFAKLTSTTDEAVYGRPLAEFMSATDMNEFREKASKLDAMKSSKAEMLLRVAAVDGRITPVHGILTAVPNREGKLDYYIWHVLDVAELTALRQAMSAYCDRKAAGQCPMSKVMDDLFFRPATKVLHESGKQ